MASLEQALEEQGVRVVEAERRLEESETVVKEATQHANTLQDKALLSVNQERTRGQQLGAVNEQQRRHLLQAQQELEQQRRQLQTGEQRLAETREQLEVAVREGGDAVGQVAELEHRLRDVRGEWEQSITQGRQHVQQQTQQHQRQLTFAQREVDAARAQLEKWAVRGEALEKEVRKTIQGIT
jgi:chromosome segregation ATPase